MMLYILKCPTQFNRIEHQNLLRKKCLIIFPKEQSQIIIDNASRELKEKFSHEIMEKQLLEFIQKTIN